MRATWCLLSAVLVLLGPTPPSHALPALPSPAMRPVPGPVVRSYDAPEPDWLPGHRGVDLAAAPGEEVRAAGAGTVTFAGVLAGRGVVVVDHGEVRTTYEPVAAEVAAGTRVAAGEVLGRVEAGHPGCPVAACLHLGLREGERYLDPNLLLGPRRISLVPDRDRGPHLPRWRS